MRRLRPKPRRAAALAAAVALGILLAGAGCSYLKWKHEKQVARAQRRAHPTLVLDKEIAPEDCFVVTGRGVAPPDGRLDPAVARARAKGRSWGRIAIPLGTSRQAARERFEDSLVR